MLYNYLKTTWRSLLRHKRFSLINIFGLAFGMTAALLILQYVQYEWSFDTFHADSERIYRVVNDRYQNGERIQRGTITYSMVGPTMVREMPEVEAYTRMMPMGRTGITVNEEVFTETEVMFADEYFFDMFSFPLLAGDATTVLKDVQTVAISQALADKYFEVKEGKYEEVVGKMLTIQGNAFKLTGVFADVPSHSHLQFDVLVSYQTLVAQAGENADNGFDWSDFYHYVRIDDESNLAGLAPKLEAFGVRHFGEGDVSGSVERFSLQPLADAHLYSNLEYEIGVTGNGKAVSALFAIALFILLIAWINYINLTTARSIERAREVGVRKVLGATRRQLVWQFMAESMVFNISGLMIALAMMEFLQPVFNGWLELELSLAILAQDGQMLALLIATFVGGMILSGFYPALVLSKHQPASVLKGNFAHSTQGNLLRKGLVVFQFACSVTLIIGTLTIYQQLDYMQNQDLGIDLEQTLVVEGPYLTQWDSTFIERIHTFKTETERHPNIHQATASARIPGNRLPRVFNLSSPKTGKDQTITASRMNIDHDFMEVYGLEVVAGRAFRATDHHQDWQALSHVMLNEAAARKLGYADPNEVVGQKIQMGDRPWEVAGVVADFHQRSLQQPMEPIVFLPAYSTYDYYSFKISEQAPETSIAAVREAYDKLFPGNPFVYFFMDKRFESQYRDDQRFGELFSLFSLLAICIACLGLFGLASYSTLQRTKEISIRKILGASVPQLFVLLSRQFIMLVIFAYILALPLAYWGVKEWLAGYAYAMNISWVVLLVPGLLVLLIALLTISYQTIQTARMNPVETLRRE